MIVSFVAIAMVGLLAFFIVRWADAKSSAAELGEELAAVQRSRDDARGRLDPVERELAALRTQTDALARGSMCVMNTTSQPMTITRLAVIYLDEEGQFGSFHSEPFGHGLWTLRPGQRQQISYSQGGWDGSVTYYAMWVQVGSDEFPYASVWSLDPEFCVRLYSGAG